MNILDTRTIFIGYTLSDLICAVVMTFLWLQNHKRSPGLGFWLVNFIMQLVAVILITLRGVVPDFLSIVVANTLAVAGTILFFFGMEYFVGKISSHRFNYLLLAVFFFAHSYFTFIQPSLTARNHNFAFTTLVVCIQIIWLVFHRVDPQSRPETARVGHIFIAFGLVNLFRLVTIEVANVEDFFNSGILNAEVTLFYQMLFIYLTFVMFLLVNQRLFTELERDISHRKRVEEALRESEGNLLEAQRLAHIGSWQWTVASDNVTWSDELYQIAGRNPIPPLPNLAGVSSCFTPESWARLDAAVVRTLQTEESFELDLDMLREDGSIRHTSTIGYVDHIVDGQIVSLHGTVQDITVRKRAEQSLQISETKFSLAFQNIPDGILISTLPDGEIIDANDSFYRITKTSKEFVQGKTIPELNLWDDSDRMKFIANLEKYGRVTNLEASFRKRTGEIGIGLISAEIIRLENRKCVLRVLRDITEYKQAVELALQQSQQLQILYEASHRLNCTLDLNEIYQAICDFMSINTPNDSMVISSYDLETQLITCRAFWMNHHWMDVSSFPPIPLEEENRGTQSLVIRSGQSIIINDYEAYLKTTQTSYYVLPEKGEIIEEPLPDEAVIQSALIVPLKIGSMVTGAIQVMSLSRNAYTENHLKLLEALALHIASAEQNALLYTQVQSELNERKQTELALYQVQNLLLAEKELLSTTLMSIGDGVIVTDKGGIVVLFNRAAEFITGYTLTEAINQPVTHTLKLNISSKLDTIPDVATYLDELEKAQKKYVVYRTPVLIAKSGKRILVSGGITSLKSTEEQTVGYVIVFHDITEKQKAEEQNLLSQKMEAVGQLAAGIAHEINTPIQYVGDNIKFLEKAYSKYSETLASYQQLLHERQDQCVSQADLDLVDGLARQKKVKYYNDEIPKAIQEALDGTDRVRKIVLAMREFSHPSEKEKKFSDINHGIETTIVISRNEWKYCADLETDLDKDLPLVFCQIDEINQVLLNMVVNAAQAIQEKLAQAPEEKGKILIRTRQRNNRVIISIQDTGSGISPEIRERIYDPFFTTKAIGKGTGQGLSIGHNIIVKKHEGTISVDSVPGQGTTFTIELPVDTSILRQK